MNYTVDLKVLKLSYLSWRRLSGVSVAFQQN